MQEGFFLVLEGIDKCGKSTQIKMLAKRYQKQGLSFVLTREPGGTPVGEKIRGVLLDVKNDISARTELLLYEASRAQHVDSVIAPALRAGRLVFCDRFSLATVAYQGLGRRLSLGMIHRLNGMATGGIEPDLTIVLDIPVSVSVARMGTSRDRLEQRTSFLKSVRAAYRRLAMGNRRIRLLKAGQSKESLHEAIAALVESHPKFKKAARG